VTTSSTPVQRDLGLDDPNLPPATVKACRECPWLRDSRPGHLGPIDADDWLLVAHSDAPIACHMTLTCDDPAWETPGLRQCAGSAQFRSNVFKSPRNPAVATADQRDDSQVFGTSDEFREHHA
jgi:predicted dithiol-disulfide oxidoreductase (DUF899 family)